MADISPDSISVSLSPSLLLPYSGLERDSMTHFNSDSARNNSVHCRLSERIELQSVRSSHEVRFQKEATPSVIFEDPQVQLHAEI